MKIDRRIALLVLAVTAINLGTLHADEAHMRRALQHLRAARAELQRAEHDKAVWRSRAINYVDQAIAATQSGIKSAR